MGEYSLTLPPLKTEPEYISGSVFYPKENRADPQTAGVCPKSICT